VNDAAAATVLAARTPGTRTRSFNTSGDIRPVKEVADYVRKLLPGADITLLPGAMGLEWKFDTRCIEEELGFRPQWSMKQGVKEVVDTTRKWCGLPPV
jgi:nucleoside-diphosphate-sugar epimerase